MAPPSSPDSFQRCASEKKPEFRRESSDIFLTMKFRFIFVILVELNLNLTPNSRRRPTPALPIPSLQQRPKNVETEKRLRALKTGLKINGISYETNVNELEYLSELGNGTSGHVVKMRHKPSGAIIAVKVRIQWI